VGGGDERVALVGHRATRRHQLGVAGRFAGVGVGEGTDEGAAGAFEGVLEVGEPRVIPHRGLVVDAAGRDLGDHQRHQRTKGGPVRLGHPARPGHQAIPRHGRRRQASVQVGERGQVGDLVAVHLLQGVAPRE